MLYADEFPHVAQFLVKTKTSDGGGGGTESWQEYLGPTAAFFDTPSSREEILAMQTTNPLERYLYLPFRTDVNAKMRVKEVTDTDFEETYELIGRPMDQGGQREVIRVALRSVVDNG